MELSENNPLFFKMGELFFTTKEVLMITGVEKNKLIPGI